MLIAYISSIESQLLRSKNLQRNDFEKNKEQEEARKLIEKDSKDKAEQYEYEVKLRMQFETKLNGMHSLHRMVESQLITAKHDRDKAIDENKDLYEQIMRFK